ncbi:SH3 domain-containing protein [[Candida] zeylanoides]
MSVPLINRSLTTIRTELEFLLDSEVITSELHQKLVQALPAKYQKDSAPWGLERLQGDVGAVTAALDKTHIAPAEYAPTAVPPAAIPAAAPSAPVAEAPAVLKPPVHPPRGKPVGFCKALYDYAAQEPDDLALKKDDKIAVVEHLSEDWWKGYPRRSGPDAVGVFPANYVLVISEQEYERSRTAPAPPFDEKAAPPQYDQKSQQQSYSPTSYQPSPQQQPPPMAQYSPYPPPAANYYPPQQQPQPQQPQQYVVEGQPQQQGHPHLRKFGGKLGNAAIFGAGATLGSDLVNSIF